MCVLREYCSRKLMVFIYPLPFFRVKCIFSLNKQFKKHYAIENYTREWHFENKAEEKYLIMRLIYISYFYFSSDSLSYIRKIIFRYLRSILLRIQESPLNLPSSPITVVSYFYNNSITRRHHFALDNLSKTTISSA